MNLRSSPLFKEYIKFILDLHSLFEKRRKSRSSEGPPVSAEIEEKIQAKKAEIDKLKSEAEQSGLSFPLEKLCKEYGLNNLERDIILLLFARSFLEGITYASTSGKEVLRSLIPDPIDVMLQRQVIMPEGKLMKEGLVHVYRFAREGDPFLDGGFCLGEPVLSYLLGETEDRGDWKNKRGEGEQVGFFHRHRGRDSGPLLEIREPGITFNQVILPEGHRERISEALNQLVHQNLIFNDWGFKETLPYGKGVTILFSGPPGTGKTLTAAACADFLGLKLGVVRPEGVVDLFVGETEKNVSRVFQEAKKENCLLFFDECDSLFQSRYSGRTAVDRTENRSVNILLREIERSFEGAVILATNRVFDLDEALERRISLKLSFPVPDAGARAAIWRGFFPAQAPLDPQVEFRALAQEFELSGGEIKNAVLRALRRIGSQSDPGHQLITQNLLEEVAREELESRWSREDRKRIGF